MKKGSRKLYLFSTPSCSGCKVLKHKFEERGVKFTHINCADGKKETNNLISKCEVKSCVPVTVILDADDIKYWEAGTSVDINEVEAILAGAR